MGPTAFLASVSFGKNQNSVTAAFILTFHNVQIYFRSFRKKKGGGGGKGVQIRFVTVLGRIRLQNLLMLGHYLIYISNAI